MVPAGQPVRQEQHVVDVAPFRALRYDPAVAGPSAATSAPSYEDVERFAYAQHRTANPYTVLELIAPRTLDSGGFQAAGEAFQRWLRTGVLTEEPEPAMYLYEEHELRRAVPAVQRGVLAAVRLAPPGTGNVLPHEGVDPRRVQDRVRRIEAVPADLSPVFALCIDPPAAFHDLLSRQPAAPPLLGLSDDAGVDHRVWAIPDPAERAALAEALADVSVLIADGHHRYEAALAYRDLARRRHDNTDGPWERTLMYLVDAAVHGPRVQAIHRLVTAMPEDAAERLGADFAMEPASDDPAQLLRALHDQPGCAFGLRLPGRSLLLRARPDAAQLQQRLPDHSPAGRSLDTAVLHHAVLPMLGEAAAASIAYRTDTEQAFADVDATPATGLFLLRPVAIQTVIDLANAGEPMPPKTTSFVPKPRAGLVLRRLHPDPEDVQRI
jgi:uncharacterized protein (DUF1015 family)